MNTKGDALTNPNKPNLPPCLRQAGVDIDISALAFDAAGNQLDACFFKKPEACNGAIGNMGDNTTGFGYVDTRFFQACDILLLFFLLVFSPRNNTLGPIKCVATFKWRQFLRTILYANLMEVLTVPRSRVYASFPPPHPPQSVYTSY